VVRSVNFSYILLAGVVFNRDSVDDHHETIPPRNP